MAERIQLRRVKGWRLPENTVVVARPTKWGNPFSIAAAVELGFATKASGPAFVVECFRDWLGPTQRGKDRWQGPESDRHRKPFIEDIGELRGQNLACWCSTRPGTPCHADLLLELANPTTQEPGVTG